MKRLLYIFGLSVALIPASQALAQKHYGTGGVLTEGIYEPAAEYEPAAARRVGVYSQQRADQPLPSKLDLSRWLPPAGRQGEQGSCSAWAIAYALRSALERQAMN